MLLTKRYTYDEIYEIINCLDLHSRILIGQYDNILDYINWNSCKGYFYVDTDKISLYLYLMRNIFIPRLNSDSRTSLGIWGEDTPENAVKSYDIQQILRYQMAWYDNPEGGYTVNYYDPMISSKWNNEEEEEKNIIKECSQDFVNKCVKRDYFRLQQWCEPCVIKKFDDQNKYVELLISQEADNIIYEAKVVSGLVKNRKITELFAYLYPDVDVELYQRYIKSFQDELNKEENKRYYGQKEIQ